MRSCTTALSRCWPRRCRPRSPPMLSSSSARSTSRADPQVTDELDRHPESYTAQRAYGRDNPMTELDAEHARRAIVEHTQRLAESAAAAGPDSAVPTTPQWTITDLVEHVGQTQHWVAEIIERRITDPTQLPTEMAVLPTDPHEWQAWLSESAQRVASACSDDALDAPVFKPRGRRAVRDTILDIQPPQRGGHPRL